MKRMTRILTLVLALCMLFTLNAFASGEPSGEPSGEASAAPVGVVPGTYTAGGHTLVIADDMTFSLEKTGANMEGAEFVLTVSGTVTADGVFTITGLTDGMVELVEMATEEQLAADLATVVETYKAATAAPAAAGVAAGTYTDGVNTLVIADDLTFVMNKSAENMDGAGFSLTVAGTVTPDGAFTITSLRDGDLELIDLATADQLAADLDSVQAAFAG